MVQTCSQIYMFSLSFSSSFVFQTGKFTSSYISNSNDKWNDISKRCRLNAPESWKSTIRSIKRRFGRLRNIKSLRWKTYWETKITTMKVLRKILVSNGNSKSSLWTSNRILCVSLSINIATWYTMLVFWLFCIIWNLFFNM